jgi:hypothetical protein
MKVRSLQKWGPLVEEDDIASLVFVGEYFIKTLLPLKTYKLKFNGTVHF